MYDDCRDITMYPLQMVLPLISQHVGATQSSTIGKPSFVDTVEKCEKSDMWREVQVLM